MFTERWPDIVSPNPGGRADPLGESVLDLSQDWLRVFEPRDTRLVIGRGQDPQRELHVAHAQADGVAVHRRVAGGGAVVLGPGMAVVAIRLAPRRADPDCVFGMINAGLIPAVAEVAGEAPACRGHGDLAMTDAAGIERKIMGASLRQTAQMTVYLSVLLVTDAVAAMRRYLDTPSRMPAYRSERDHADFCTSLDRYGVATPVLLGALERHLRVTLQDEALLPVASS